MNKFIGIAAVALALAAPAASFAQSNQPLTRAEVREQLIQLEAAGYNPSAVNDAQYPADIQAAEARVSGQQAYGGVADGSAQAGARGGVALQPDDASTFAHH
jgi:hypothetical protein